MLSAPRISAAYGQWRLDSGRMSPAEMVRLGEDAAAGGDVIRATEMGYRARKKDPAYWPAPNLLGVLYARTGQPDRARQFFREAAAAAPSEAAPRLNLARLELSSGRVDRALEWVQPVVEKNPNSAEAWSLLAEAHRSLGALVSARDAYREAVKLRADLAPAQVALGQLELGFDHYDRAATHLEAAYSLGERQPLALSLLALAHAAAPKSPAEVDRAQALLAEAGDPDIPPAWFARGFIARAHGRHAEARALFQKILKQDPRNERAQYALGETLRRLGDAEGARTAFAQHDALVKQREAAARKRR